MAQVVVCTAVSDVPTVSDGDNQLVEFDRELSRCSDTQ